jgi:OFA family oxalate/formate antiporter-like MFS transporter
LIAKTGTSTAAPHTRWVQLGLAIACMVAIANLQYAWTLFVPEIQTATGWNRAAIQTTFTIFVVLQTWLTPIEGIFLDKFGPRVLVLAGGVLTGACWLIYSQATTLTHFYIGAAVGGIGVGAVYVTAANVAVRWFADRRGLAAGLVGAGFGAGSALTLIPINNMIKAEGYHATFLLFGLIIGGVILLAGCIIRQPREGEAPKAVRPMQSKRDYSLGEALRMPLFYVMFAIVTLVITGGLMAVAQLGVIAKDLGVKDAPIDVGFFAMAALPFALMIDRIVNGFSRPFFGWVSDHIGRENTMFIAFGLEGIGIVSLGLFGANPWAFLLMTGVVFFAWGEIYSLFSAVTADTFGTKNYGKIYGVLYCSKGVGALLVPFANIIMEATGSWSGVLHATAAMNFLAAILAMFVLKPMLARHHALDRAQAPQATLATAGS